MTTDDFKKLLQTRLRLRTSGGVTCEVLDLRHKRFGNYGVLTVRDPSHPKWPDEGATTDDRAVSERWVRDRYTEYLRAELEASALYPDLARVTVAMACKQYLEALEEELGPRHNTYVNRRSDIQAHIVPRFGSMPLLALDHLPVWQWLTDLKSHHPDGRGGFRAAKAKPARKRALRASLVAVWEDVAPYVPCPFKGVRIKGGGDVREHRKRIAAGDLEELLKPKSGAMTPADAMRVFVAAAYYDRQLAADAKTAARSVANTLLAIIVCIATGMRIAELCTLRWGHIDEAKGIIHVLGTKTEAALRVVPLQEKLRPWLAVLRELARPAGAPKDWTPPPDALVFVMTRVQRPDELTSTRTLQSRVTKALLLAGLKLPGKATHWMRATFATWASRETRLISNEELKRYLGHATAYGGATDRYVETLLELMKPGHRRIIRHLPTPAEVEQALATFTPEALPHWRGAAAAEERDAAEDGTTAA